MATSSMKPGIPVTLKELEPSSTFFKQGASLRVTGKIPENSALDKFDYFLILRLQAYSVDTAIAVIIDGDASIKIDTQHLRNTSFRIGSIYQFIGELLIQPDNDVILQARVGRNVDGIDLNLYYQSLQLRRQFEAELMNSRAT